MTDTHTDIDDFLFGGGGSPAAKFPAPGATVKGTVIRATVQQARDLDNKPKFWDDGNPVKQLVVWLQTEERNPEIEDDDGIRRIFAGGSVKAESKSMRAAIMEALRKAGSGGRPARLEPGGTLAVRYVGDGPRNPQRPALNPPKQYVAQYEPPKPGVSADDIASYQSSEELF
jgi:hypothetical protein